MPTLENNFSEKCMKLAYDFFIQIVSRPMSHDTMPDFSEHFRWKPLKKMSIRRKHMYILAVDSRNQKNHYYTVSFSIRSSGKDIGCWKSIKILLFTYISQTISSNIMVLGKYFFINKTTITNHIRNASYNFTAYSLWVKWIKYSDENLIINQWDIKCIHAQTDETASF